MLSSVHVKDLLLEQREMLKNLMQTLRGGKDGVLTDIMSLFQQPGTQAQPANTTQELALYMPPGIYVNGKLIPPATRTANIDKVSKPRVSAAPLPRGNQARLRRQENDKFVPSPEKHTVKATTSECHSAPSIKSSSSSSGSSSSTISSKSKDIGPFAFETQHKAFREHARLTAALLSVVNNRSFGLKPRMRYLMHDGILSLHYDINDDLRAKHTAPKLTALFKEYSEVAEYWTEECEKDLLRETAPKVQATVLCGAQIIKQAAADLQNGRSESRNKPAATAPVLTPNLTTAPHISRVEWDDQLISEAEYEELETSSSSDAIREPNYATYNRPAETRYYRRGPSTDYPEHMHKSQPKLVNNPRIQRFASDIPVPVKTSSTRARSYERGRPSVPPKPKRLWTLSPPASYEQLADSRSSPRGDSDSEVSSRRIVEKSRPRRPNSTYRKRGDNDLRTGSIPANGHLHPHSVQPAVDDSTHRSPATRYKNLSARSGPAYKDVRNILEEDPFDSPPLFSNDGKPTIISDPAGSSNARLPPSIALDEPIGAKNSPQKKAKEGRKAKKLWKAEGDGVIDLDALLGGPGRSDSHWNQHGYDIGDLNDRDGLVYDAAQQARLRAMKAKTAERDREYESPARMRSRKIELERQEEEPSQRHHERILRETAVTNSSHIPRPIGQSKNYQKTTLARSRNLPGADLGIRQCKPYNRERTLSPAGPCASSTPDLYRPRPWVHKPRNERRRGTTSWPEQEPSSLARGPSSRLRRPQIIIPNPALPERVPPDKHAYQSKSPVPPLLSTTAEGAEELFRRNFPNGFESSGENSDPKEQIEPKGGAPGRQDDIQDSDVNEFLSMFTSLTKDELKTLEEL